LRFTVFLNHMRNARKRAAVILSRTVSSNRLKLVTPDQGRSHQIP
jgi:hypothetical protein